MPLTYICGMAKQGRPPQYTPKMIDVLDAATGDTMGAGTITDIANVLGVPYRNVYRWGEEYPEFWQAVMRVRDRADQLVVSALRKRSTGYDVEVEEDRLTKDGDVQTLKKKVHVPADGNSAKFWLMNRQRKDWTERREVDVNMAFSDMVEEYLRDGDDE